MEPMLFANADFSETELVEETNVEELMIHAWRAEQLQRLGLPWLLAEAFAELADWHEVAELIARGCKPELALEIVR